MAKIKVYSKNGKSLHESIKELKGYGYLIRLLIRRDLIASFKQSLLGAFWFVFQPILTALVYTIIFGIFVRMPTDGYPAFIFFFSGLVVWNGFTLTLTKVSYTFLENANVFGKVYFPRLVAPISSTIATSVNILVQLIVLLLASVYFRLRGAPIVYSFKTVGALAILLLAIAFGAGLGMLVASLSVKYRDLIYALPFLTSVLMYASPILYSLSAIPEAYRKILLLNPMTGIVMNFKFCMFGIGEFDLFSLLYSCAVCGVVFALGVSEFNRVQASFVDMA